MGERAIPRLLEAEARDGCRLRLRYNDGASGEVDRLLSLGKAFSPPGATPLSSRPPASRPMARLSGATTSA